MKYYVTAVCLLVFSGCSGVSGVQPGTRTYSSHITSDYIVSSNPYRIGKKLAYAVLDKKTLKLKRIVGSLRKNDIDYAKEEVIVIGEKGFSLYENISKNAVCQTNNDSSPNYCKSVFVTADMSGTNGMSTVVTNTVLAPLVLLNGNVAYRPKLNEKKLKEVIEKNRLDYYRRRLLEVSEPLRYFDATPLSFDAIVQNYDLIYQTQQKANRKKAEESRKRRTTLAKRCKAGMVNKELCYKYGFSYPTIKRYADGKIKLRMLTDKNGRPAGECKEYDRNGRLLRGHNFMAEYRVLNNGYEKYIRSVATDKTSYECPKGYEACGSESPEVTYVHVGGLTCATKRVMQGCCEKVRTSYGGSSSRKKECRMECRYTPTAYGYTHRSCRRVCY